MVETVLCDNLIESNEYFHVILFIVLHKVGLTFNARDETVTFDHSNESYRAVIHKVLITMIYRVVPTFTAFIDF